MCVLLSEETMYMSASFNRILKVLLMYKYKHISIYLFQGGKATEVYGPLRENMN